MKVCVLTALLLDGCLGSEEESGASGIPDSSAMDSDVTDESGDSGKLSDTYLPDDSGGDDSSFPDTCVDTGDTGESIPCTDCLYIEVGTGAYVSCGITAEGEILCWGMNADMLLAPPAGLFTSLDLHNEAACAVDVIGELQCWGYDPDGLFEELPSVEFAHVDIGGHHLCGLLTDGTVYCWGDDDVGETEAPGSTFTQLGVGVLHTCGLHEDGSVECWGIGPEDAWYYLDYDFGQVTDTPDGSYVFLATGDYGNCAIDAAGVVTCWGAVGDAAEIFSGNFSQVVVGSAYRCGITLDGEIVCSDLAGTDEDVVPTGSEFVQIDVGRSHACALEDDGEVVCWGEDYFGETDPP